jgi:hypothetical protein
MCTQSVSLQCHSRVIQTLQSVSTVYELSEATLLSRSENLPLYKSPSFVSEHKGLWRG